MSSTMQSRPSRSSTRSAARQMAASAIEHYDRIAISYDAERFGCRCGRIVNQTELDIVASLLKHGGRTLDIGTGSGRFSRMATGLSRDVVALDASARMISVAAAKAGDA